MADTENPKIIVYVCGWHPATAVDNAGDGTSTYGSNIRVIAVNCLGRLSPSHILRAFSSGADGVLVVGCGPGDCHYSNGNERCQPVVDRCTRLLDLMGIDKERLRFQLTSDVDGAHFCSMLNEFDHEIRTLGLLRGAEV